MLSQPLIEFVFRFKLQHFLRHPIAEIFSSYRSIYYGKLSSNGLSVSIGNYTFLEGKNIFFFDCQLTSVITFFFANVN